MKEEKESGAKVLGTMAGFLVEPYVTSGIKKAVTKGGGAVINSLISKTIVEEAGSKGGWKFKPEIPRTAVKNSEGNYTLDRNNEWSVGNKFENASQNNNTSNYINRIINKDGTSNIPKGTGYTTIDNRPYIENGKPKGRPSFRKGFEQKLYNQYGGIVQDPNTKEIINWKPGEPKKGIVDFGHKPKYKYSDYFKRYKNEEVTPKELRDWYNDPTHYQFEVPLNNEGHKYE